MSVYFLELSSCFQVLLWIACVCFSTQLWMVDFTLTSVLRGELLRLVRLFLSFSLFSHLSFIIVFSSGVMNGVALLISSNVSGLRRARSLLNGLGRRPLRKASATVTWLTLLSYKVRLVKQNIYSLIVSPAFCRTSNSTDVVTFSACFNKNRVTNHAEKYSKFTMERGGRIPNQALADDLRVGGKSLHLRQSFTWYTSILVLN